jgi:4-diphosphocytidyl-2-C-methyl-D-erythritol kinase
VATAWRVRTACKVNLHLGVGPRRGDGYHPVRTVLQALDLGDTLTLRPAEPGRVELAVRGDRPAPHGSDNLVHRAMTLALAAARRRDGFAPGARMILHKRLRLGRRRLLDLARRLGSDVPFFLMGGLASGRDRGDRIRELAPLPLMHALVVTPPWPLSTHRVYGWFDRRSLTSGGDGFRMRPALGRLRQGRPLEAFHNDLEAPVLRRHPELARARDLLLAAGALVAGLAGSGSSVFGLFRRPVRIAGALRDLHGGGWETRRCRTLSGPAYRARFGTAAGRD